MVRPLQIEFPGALYHVAARGDRREPIFEDDEDRRVFLSTLAEVVERCNWLCHAYCLMTNHYHLAVATPGANISRDYTYRQIAKYFGLHLATVGRVIRQQMLRGEN